MMIAADLAARLQLWPLPVATGNLAILGAVVRGQTFQPRRLGVPRLLRRDRLELPGTVLIQEHRARRTACNAPA